MFLLAFTKLEAQEKPLSVGKISDVNTENILDNANQKATSGLKDTLKTQVRIGFSVENNVLKTKHDTAKNSGGNIR